ncbi:hypothetical protein P153DRAFT_359353 [Dothidotthia symphoricarpi CBS 119687]|uniref:REJ domain-containing protein n=1 Tax=Dothidotthia symphoricarpi CBS 119687 TaxID=1392245 RepID=A0A6A6A3F6_9PLEO|nr:uncharacterized protein P153DRAFT_359353 [Dothidotthia symphoricarpi CBS 119687]KAF2126340.1 hypothetical protein P153DRAFT_359353 [Dothidotthia symphoricarpi CBS 119687]
MARALLMLVLGLGAAVCAQNSKTSDTGPMFNPSEAPFFDYSQLVVPTQTPQLPQYPDSYSSSSITPSLAVYPTQTPSITRSASSVVSSLALFRSHSIVSSARNSTIASSTFASGNSTVLLSTSSHSSASRASTSSVTLSTATSASRSASSSSLASASAPASTGAAVAKYPRVIGIIAGGLFAGLVMA